MWVMQKTGGNKKFNSFKPKKSFLHFIFKTNESPKLSQKVEDTGIDVTYQSCWKQYRVSDRALIIIKKHKE